MTKRTHNKRKEMTTIDKPGLKRLRYSINLTKEGSLRNRVKIIDQ